MSTTIDTRREARAGRSTRRVGDGTDPAAVVLGLDQMNGLQTARILAARGVPVIGVATDPAHPCSRTRVCTRRIVVRSDDRIVPALRHLGPTLSERAVLIPCTDRHVRTVSRHREELEPWYHVVLPEARTVELLMDKVAFYTFAQEEGLPLPPTRFLRSRSDAEHAAVELPFPCVLKPPLSAEPAWEEHSKLKAYVVPTPEALLELYDRHAALSDVLIAQAWIPGPSSELYSCNCYFDRHGVPRATFVARKVRQWPPDTGESSLGEECRNDEVLRVTLDLFRRVGFRGLGYLEMKRDASTGEHFIVEPNVGRPTGRSAIAEAGGVELLAAMYRDAVGRPLPPSLEQRYGHAKWMDIRRDLQSAVHHWRRGDLTLRDWWRSVRGRKAYALFSWTDPLPFIADLVRAGRLFLSSEERRKRDYTRPLS